MKNFLIAFLFMIFQITLNSQSLINLDAKNGIFEFKFGSSFFEHESKLKFELKGGDDVKYYKYIGSDHPTVLGERYEEFILGFYNNKLHFINVSFRLGGDTFDNYLLEKIEGLFGKGTPLNAGNQGTWAYAWETDKNYAQIVKDEYKNLNESNYGKLVFMFYSKQVMKKIINDGF